MRFDSYPENKEGKQYYYKVYEENNPEHVDGTRENMAAPKNLYAYVLQNGLHK